MKKSILLLLAVTLSFTSFAQGEFKEGKVVSTQTMSSDDEAMNSQLAMVGDVVTTTYVKGTKSRSEVSSPMTGDVVTISDNESKKLLMLMDDPMGGKNYMTIDMDPAQAQVENIEVKNRDDKKTVLGYDCDGYDVTMKAGGQEVEMTIYTTKKIKAFSQQSQMYGDKIEGFPMHFVMNMSQMGKNITIENTVTDIKEGPVSGDKFNMTPPEGYKEMKQ
ncbi:DUF4412 domain-containing protein [Bizionia paragorgiae]|uniref:DUF4412 domain-containing protein n=1 Tax=Bizionia paragorgiae TaxID=283786 RepID=A0A1H3ZQX5_BIZPA|nr:DUF4412 domain-containing protein [Bizionia paragorgiae]MDX1271033.1 DUF4412 domain-containing protein [Bizionia paragorgiae]SEA25672.1 Domain of unknown function [Bizionia paragorgiae]